MYAAAQRPAQAVRPREILLGAFDRAMAWHPVLTLTAAMMLMGTGMVLAAAMGTVTCILPIALLMGWI